MNNLAKTLGFLNDDDMKRAPKFVIESKLSDYIAVKLRDGNFAFWDKDLPENIGYADSMEEIERILQEGE